MLPLRCRLIYVCCYVFARTSRLFTIYLRLIVRCCCRLRDVPVTVQFADARLPVYTHGYAFGSLRSAFTRLHRLRCTAFAVHARSRIYRVLRSLRFVVAAVQFCRFTLHRLYVTYRTFPVTLLPPPFLWFGLRYTVLPVWLPRIRGLRLLRPRILVPRSRTHVGCCVSFPRAHRTFATTRVWMRYARSFQFTRLPFWFGLRLRAWFACGLRFGCHVWLFGLQLTFGYVCCWITVRFAHVAHVTPVCVTRLVTHLPFVAFWFTVYLRLVTVWLVYRIVTRLPHRGFARYVTRVPVSFVTGLRYPLVYTRCVAFTFDWILRFTFTLIRYVTFGLRVVAHVRFTRLRLPVTRLRFQLFFVCCYIVTFCYGHLLRTRITLLHLILFPHDPHVF